MQWAQGNDKELSKGNDSDWEWAQAKLLGAGTGNDSDVGD